MPYTMGCMDSLLALDPNPEVGTFRWWEAQRWKYNVGMLVAGPTAFVLYAIATWIWVPMPEITLFTMLFQGIGYLFAMGLANVFYFVGPLGEMLVSLRKRALYRRVVFALGFWFSVGLPFLVPLMIVLFYCPLSPMFRPDLAVLDKG